MRQTFKVWFALGLLIILGAGVAIGFIVTITDWIAGMVGA